MARNTLRLVVTADGKVAIREFDEVGAASTRAGEKVEKSARKQQDSLARVEHSTGRLKGAIGTLAGYAGLGGLAVGFADVVKAGEQFQLQQAQMQTALRNTGQLSKRTMDMLLRSAEALSTHGGFAPTENLAALTQFVRLTGSATEAIKLNKAATDLARGTGLGYTQTQRMLGQVMTGNVGRLQRYLGIIQPVKTAEFALSQQHKVNILQLEAQSKSLGKLGPLWLKQQEILHGLTPDMVAQAKALDRQSTAQEALRLIQEKYGGSTRTFSNTTAGALSNLHNSFHILEEHIGIKVLPILNTLVRFLDRNKTAVLQLLGVVAGMAAAVGMVKFARAFWDAASSVGGAVKAILRKVGLMATTTVAADTEIEAANVAAGSSFTAMLGPIGLAAAAVYGLYTLLHKTQHFAAGTSAQAVAQGMAKHGSGFATGAILGQLQKKGAFKHHAAGGLIHHMAAGGPVGSDTVPLWGTPGEFMLRRETVQNIGVGTLNSINASGSLAGAGSGSREAWVTMPITLMLPGGRVLTEQVVHTAAQRQAVS